MRKHFLENFPKKQGCYQARGTSFELIRPHSIVFEVCCNDGKALFCLVVGNSLVRVVLCPYQLNTSNPHDNRNLSLSRTCENYRSTYNPFETDERPIASQTQTYLAHMCLVYSGLLFL